MQKKLSVFLLQNAAQEEKTAAAVHSHLMERNGLKNMKPTETPAYKPATDCIQKYFQNNKQKYNIKEDFIANSDNPYGNSGCIIMASGQGTRFGGNKLLADFGGKPLIQWVLDVSKVMFSKRIVVTIHKEIENLCKNQNIPVILHSFPYRNDVVRIGIEKIGCQIDRCAFLLADQPLIKKETLSSLVIFANNEPDFIWRACYKETIGSPVVFPKKYFNELKSLPQGKGGNAVILKHAENVRNFPVSNQYELEDIDTQEDLERLLKKISQF